MLKYLWLLIIIGGLAEKAFSPRVSYVAESKMLILYYNKILDSGEISRVSKVLVKI